MAAAQSSDGDATDPAQRGDGGPADGPILRQRHPSRGPVGGTGSDRAGPAAPMSGAELEEMARRLYEPLSARLRAELWQDRERSGLLTDLRP